MRSVNRYKVLYKFSMPNTQQELIKIAMSKYFENFDLYQTNWELPLPKDLQEAQSFISPDEIISLTPAMHGSTNAEMYYNPLYYLD